jgi:glutamate dehydrogenase/leucine dehydrogenase
MSMWEPLLREWDGEAVIVHYDPPTGAWIFIAIHSTHLGPATGGTRMKQYPEPKDALADALKLASGMTYKFAVIGFERGGGKAVISVPESMDSESRPGLLRRYGSLIQQLGGIYYTGPDVGTSPADMDIIAETGAPFVFCRTPAAGGAGSSGPLTALGVFVGIQAACERVFQETSMRHRKVLVQGLGSVGCALIEHLLSAGAEVLFSEVDEPLIRHFRETQGLQFIPEDEVYRTECDVFAPCALGGILSQHSIPQLRCRIIVGGANNQLARPELVEDLHAKGILYIPDFVVNVGGALGITGIESLGWSPSEAEEAVAGSIRGTLQQIFELMDAEALTTEDAARRIAEERLSRSS